MTEDEKNITEANDEYIKFITDSLSTYRRYADSLSTHGDALQPYQIQYLLVNYHSAKLGLLAEMCRRRRVFKRLKQNFDLWWNSCLVKSKQDLTLPGHKYPAVKDYTLQAEENNKELYKQKMEEVNMAEEKYEFLKLLKADWDSFQFTLQILNDNMKSELRSLRLEDEMHEEESVVQSQSVTRVRRIK